MPGPVGRLRGNLGGGEPGRMRQRHATAQLPWPAEGLIARRKQIHNARGPLPGADRPLQSAAPTSSLGGILLALFEPSGGFLGCA